MATPSRDLLTLLMIAVDLRIEGATWEEVAKEVKRHERTCRRWPLLHSSEWNRLYDQADDVGASRAGLRARAVLQRDLGSKNETTRVAVSRVLTTSNDQRHARRAMRALAKELRKQDIDLEFIEMYTQAKGLSHAERCKLFEDALANGDASEWFSRGDYEATVRGSHPLAATYYVAPSQHLGLEPVTATARISGGALV